MNAVLTQAMRHSSPETKRHCLLGMHEDVRQAMDPANREFFGPDGYHILSTGTERHDPEVERESSQRVET